MAYLFPFEEPNWSRTLGFINQDGDLVIEQQYAWSAYSGFSAAGYAVVRPKERKETWVIDTKGAVKLALGPEYQSAMTPPDAYGIFPIEHRPDHADESKYELDGRDIIYTGRSNRYGMTLAGDIAFEGAIEAFSHGAYKIRHKPEGGGRPTFGIVDMAGNPRTAQDYEGMSWSMSDPYVVVTRDGKFGVIDHFGHEVIPTVHPLGQVKNYSRVTDGIAIYYDTARDMCLTVNMQGQPLAAVPTTYWSKMIPKAVPTLSEGLMKITLAGRDGGEGPSVYMDAYGNTPMLDDTGKPRMFPPEQRVGYFSGGLTTIRIKDRTGYMDKSGQVVIPVQYESAGNFRGGLAKVFFTTEDRKANRFACINKLGEVVAQNH